MLRLPVWLVHAFYKLTQRWALFATLVFDETSRFIPKAQMQPLKHDFYCASLQIALAMILNASA